MRRKSPFPEAFPISYQEQGKRLWCFWQGWSTRPRWWGLGAVAMPCMVAEGGPPATSRCRGEKLGPWGPAPWFKPG